MEDFLIEYALSDDGGFTNMYLPIILEIGTKFKNEFCIYEVVSYEFQGKELKFIFCERVK
jgi:hypothetical protein